MSDIIYRDESFKIVGAAFAVHDYLGSGFDEKVYQEAFELELQARNIPYEREKQMTVEYKGIVLGHNFFADFVCYNKIVVELKALAELPPVSEKQVINYLKASGHKLGLLINFGTTSLIYKRLLHPNLVHKRKI